MQHRGYPNYDGGRRYSNHPHAGPQRIETMEPPLLQTAYANSRTHSSPNSTSESLFPSIDPGFFEPTPSSVKISIPDIQNPGQWPLGMNARTTQNEDPWSPYTSRTSPVDSRLPPKGHLSSYGLPPASMDQRRDPKISYETYSSGHPTEDPGYATASGPSTVQTIDPSDTRHYDNPGWLDRPGNLRSIQDTQSSYVFPNSEERPIGPMPDVEIGFCAALTNPLKCDECNHVLKNQSELKYALGVHIKAI